MTFDPVRICQVLNEEAVDYVIIGGLAAALRGSPLPTEDVDVLPARDAENLDRLARALNRLNARIRTDRESVQVRIDGPFLAKMPHMLNLVTDAGILDIAFTPAGAKADFGSWDQAATSESIADGLVVRVASLDDVIASKRAANRPKDLRSLPYLESLRDADRA